MTHPSFYSPSDCLPSIPPRRGHSAHGPHQSPCTDRGWALPSPPPPIPIHYPKGSKTERRCRSLGRLIEQQNPTQMAMDCLSIVRLYPTWCRGS